MKIFPLTCPSLCLRLSDFEYVSVLKACNLRNKCLIIVMLSYKAEAPISSVLPFTLGKHFIL